MNVSQCILLMMKKGSKWELTIPPELGYGAKGVSGVIPPNATLIFDIELISVNSVAETETAPAAEEVDSQSPTTAAEESNSQPESASPTQPDATDSPSPAEEKDSTPAAEDQTTESSSQQPAEETSAEESQPEPAATQPSE